MMKQKGINVLLVGKENKRVHKKRKKQESGNPFCKQKKIIKKRIRYKELRVYMYSTRVA